MEEKSSPIVQKYLAKTPKSRSLYEQARKVFPSGVTHDSRYLQPYPIYVTRASGSHKWDVDGNEFVDYFGGHGALILGHNHPVVVEAVREQISKGTHYGACHELELEWAELITKMVPCAEKVRFTSSGTEATLLAMRVARAFKEKSKILRFKTHFHGWHDQVAFASGSHFDGSVPAGITREIMQNIVLCSPNDLAGIKKTLESQEDIAAVIIEPTGATFGRVPTGGEFLKQLRKLTQEHNVLLIFDEVISGFRCAPGGAQEYYGVTPDLAVFAKIVAGGFPGGALVGRTEIMDMMTIRSDPKWNHDHRVTHHGTFNANPLSASAAVAALKLIASTDITQKANRTGETLRASLNQVIQQEEVNWVVYGEFSSFHILPNEEDREISLQDIYSGKVDYNLLKGISPSVSFKLRMAFQLGGVDIVPWPGGLVSAIHSEVDVEKTALAFRELITLLKQEHQLV